MGRRGRTPQVANNHIGGEERQMDLCNPGDRRLRGGTPKIMAVSQDRCGEPTARRLTGDRSDAPLLGENTGELFAGARLSTVNIAALHDAGVVA